jgi:SAM-dependent methyltransferase
MAPFFALPERLVEAEWLDGLPPADARAMRSRRDLARINALMANPRRLARRLASRLGAGASIADLGAGDGGVMLALARRLKQPGIDLTLVDRAPAVSEDTLLAFRALGWRAAPAAEDAFAFLARPGGRLDAIVANLFLHHFDSRRLRRLLELAAARAPLFVACEPRRSAVALAGSRLVGLLGCNEVTRHDAVSSVRAGFRAQELSSAWPRDPAWRLREGFAWPFGHCFLAERDAAR